MRLRTCVGAVLLTAALAAPAAAQHALVLSGGGARGLAHAGAIRALEELGYEPGLVVGTSMGAIVGALYAAGYTGDEIWRIIAQENWLARFAAEPLVIGIDRAPRRPLLSFGMSSGRFQEGFVPTAYVNRRLVELFFDAGVRARNDFDRLPRRYRAVAADLSTGEEVVLGAGDLPRAVRASMAVPGVFAPVSWNGRVLVDGGVANNLPVSVARALSRDSVLAVDVIRPPRDLREADPWSVGIRALRLLIHNARPDRDADADLLVLPVLPTSEAGFPRDAGPLLDAGYAAVHDQLPARGPAQPRPRQAGEPPATVSAVSVVGAGAATTRLATRLLQPALGGYDPERIIARTRALYTTGLFVSVWPRIERGDAAGDGTLVVELLPLPRTSVAGGASWDNDVGGAVWTSLRRRADLITPIELHAGLVLDELSQEVTLDASLFSTRLPPLVWSIGGFGVEQRVRIFAADSLLGMAAFRRAGGWAGAELRGPGTEWHVSLLLRTERLDAPEPARGGWSWGPSLRLGRALTPDRIVGAEPLLRLAERWGDTPFRAGQLRGSLEGRAGGVYGALLGDVAWSSTAAPLDQQPAAERSLAPWRSAGELRAPRRLAAGADVAAPVVLDSYARLRLRAFGSGADWDAVTGAAAWEVGAEAGLVWPTVLGALEAGVAFGEGGRRRLNIGLATPVR